MQGQLAAQDLSALASNHKTNALTGWRPQGPPASSGCDSSDCTYCFLLARLRQPGAPGAATGCWLRRKRSRTELASLGDATPTSSSCGYGSGGGGGLDEDAEPWSSMQRVPSSGTLAAVAARQLPGGSMWDHALLLEEDAEECACQQQQQQQQWLQQPRPQPQSQPPRSDAGGAASSGSPCWHPCWQAPASLVEVACFVPPLAHSQRPGGGCCTDIVCALEWEEHGWLLASAGVSKQVRVYSLASRLQHAHDDSYQQPLRCHRMPSKLSSLAWNPDAPGAITVADYDGVVSQVDLESGHLIAEADEHCGRRVWSVSHSLQRPHFCASASDDGTVRLWGGPGLQSCVAALRPGIRMAPACGVHLSPFDANVAAVASADHCAYIYDLRRADQPVWQLAGHARAVSYVRWLTPARLATASIDASLAMWQLPGPTSQAAALQQQQQQLGQEPADAVQTAPPGLAGGSLTCLLAQPWKRLRGHRNSKNFVGLSVRPGDGLLACGSESPAAYAYHEAWAAPLAAHTFATACDDQLCSAVAWQPAVARPSSMPPLLAAALSSGEVRVMELRRPPAEVASRRCTDG